MAIKIQNTASIEVKYVKCLVYGGAGVGKTRLAASAPNVLIVSAESGLLSLSDGKVDFLEITSLKGLDEAYNYIKKDTTYDTIALDSLSEIAEVLVAELKPQYKDGRQAYMALADSMMPMLRKFRDLPNKHVVFTCKMIRKQDEETGKITEDLFLPGQVLGSQLPYLFDEVFKLSIDGRKGQSMMTRPDRMSFAKDRSGTLKAIETPKSGNTEISMTDIIETILKGN